MLLSTENQVDLDTVRTALPQALDTPHSLTTNSGPLAERVQNFEREVLLAELKRHSYHITNTAKALGLERSHLYKKAEQLGVDIQKSRREEETSD
jgi:DNA-binding NtrC family response regulator